MVEENKLAILGVSFDRTGFATAASKTGAKFKSIMKQGRWRHEGTVLGYIEEGRLFEENAAGTVLKKDNKGL